MSDTHWKAGNMLAPLPVVLVSCGNETIGTNIITIAWAGTINTNPPMLSISVRPNRYSHKLISETGEFVVNITTEALARATDWCGVKSGRDVDKWKSMGLTPIASQTVGTPSVGESPISIECKVRQTLHLGSHDMFVAEVTAVRVDNRYIDTESDTLDILKAQPIVYMHGGYYTVGRKIGHFGWSVKKKKNKRR